MIAVRGDTMPERRVAGTGIRGGLVRRNDGGREPARARAMLNAEC